MVCILNSRGGDVGQTDYDSKNREKYVTGTRRASVGSRNIRMGLNYVFHYCSDIGM